MRVYLREFRHLHQGIRIAVATVLVGFTTISVSAAPADSAKFTTLDSVRHASPDQVSERTPFRFSAIVLAINPDARRIQAQDDRHSITVKYAKHLDLPPIGSRVEFSGILSPKPEPTATVYSVEILEENAGLPTPVTVSVAEILDGQAPVGPLLKVRGLVQSLRTNRALARRKRLLVLLRNRSRVLSVEAPRLPPVERSPRLSVVEILGVLVRPNRPGQKPLLWLEDWQFARVIEPGPEAPFEIPPNSPAELRFGESRTLPFRVRGRVLKVLDESTFLLGDMGESKHELTVQFRPPRAVHPDEVIDLLGYPMPTGERPEFDAIDLRRLGLRLPRPDTDTNGTRISDYVPAVDSTAALRILSSDEHSDGWPVNLPGIVTYCDVDAREFFIDTGGGGSKVRWTGEAKLPELYSRIYLQGHTTEGVRRPDIAGESYRILDTDRKVLHRLTTSAAFLSGRTEGQPITMRGVVHAVDDLDGRRAVLLLKVQRDLVRAELLLDDTPCPFELTDAFVEISGISATRAVEASRWESVLLVQSPRQLEVQEAPPADPFALPPMRIREILDESWTQTRIHRVHTSGRVSFVDFDRIYLDDGTGGICVSLGQAHEFRAGDQARVAGFPSPGKPAPFLQHAVYRRTEADVLPPPLQRAPQEILAEQLTGRRVTTGGTVTGIDGVARGQLQLRNGLASFTVRLPAQTTAAHLARWPVGSEVEVTGLAVIQLYNDASAETFRVHIHRPDDITTISRPPWWNAERAVGVAVALALLAFAAFGWAAFLRRRASQSNEQFQRTFQRGPLPAWIVDPESLRCLDYNEEARLLFNLPTHAIGRPLQQLPIWPSEDEYHRVARELAANPNCRAFEIRLGNNDENYNLLLSSEPVLLMGKTHLLLTAVDLTERMKLLAELRQAQKMEAVGQLATGVAHDFNNLLTVIRANSSLALLNRDLDPETRMLNQEIDQASERAAELTEHLLAFSRKSVLNPRCADLNDVVRSAHKMLRRVLGENIEFHLDCAREPLKTVIDCGLIEQVLLNFGVNARDAMSDGGEFRLSTRRVSYSPENLPLHPDAVEGDYAIIEATDTGHGMSREILNRIFEPFFTTKEVGKGSGLGLSTAYGILRQHHGWIQVASTPGAGSRFQVHIPINETADAESTGALVPAESFRGSETILVVDDDEEIRRIVDRALRHYGYRVFAARDSLQARQVWQQHGEAIDLLLTDLVMPNGVSGLEIARTLLDTRADLKVVYMSGHSQELLAHGARLQTGFNFIAKPFVSRDLARLIRHRLDSQSDKETLCEAGVDRD